MKGSVGARKPLPQVGELDGLQRGALLVVGRAAVAEDLVRRRITSPRHLGIEGGSNGGLLVGAVMTQRPELFNAVVCQVPLLDMKRFHKLLAGASWMAE